MGQFIGLDIHRKFIQVCVMDRMGVVSQELRLELQEPERLRSSSPASIRRPRRR